MRTRRAIARRVHIYSIYWLIHYTQICGVGGTGGLSICSVCSFVPYSADMIVDRVPCLAEHPYSSVSKQSRMRRSPGGWVPKVKNSGMSTHTDNRGQLKNSKLRCEYLYHQLRPAQKLKV